MAVLTGSLPRASYRRAVWRLSLNCPAALKLEWDLDETPPEVYTAFRARIRSADAVLFVTPEYNRSVPGGLKNAVNVGSRPSQENAWRRSSAGAVERFHGSFREVGGGAQGG